VHRKTISIAVVEETVQNPARVAIDADAIAISSHKLLSPEGETAIAVIG
jgi:selenocysteine lyase/cysteine desulfurase